MATQKGPCTCSDNFKFEEEKALPTTKFFDTYKNSLPMMAIIIDGIYGLTRYDSYDCYQVIRIHCCTAQPRVVCMTEKEAEKLSCTFLTIPVRTDLRYQVIRNKKTVSEPMLMSSILKKFPLPVLARLVYSDRQRSVKVGATLHSTETFGDFLIVEEYSERYLKLNCLHGATDIKMTPTSCMLCLNDEITLTPITGFENGSKQEYWKFLEQLDKLAASNPSQYDRDDGDPNFAEHHIIPSQPQKDGRAIPVSILAADALKLIRSSHDGPLPALPSLTGPKPKLPLPSENSCQAAQPPPRPPRPTKKALSSVDEDNGDYDVVDETILPAIPPRGVATVKSQPHTQASKEDEDSPDDYEEIDETLAYAIPVKNTSTKPPDAKKTNKKETHVKKQSNELSEHPKEKAKTGSSETHYKKPKNPKTGDGKSDKDSASANSSACATQKTDQTNSTAAKKKLKDKSTKIPYENTNIGRAEVKPQQQQQQRSQQPFPVKGEKNGRTEGIYLPKYDSVMVLQNKQTVYKDKCAEEDPDAEYTVMADIDLPPPATTQQQQQTQSSTGTNPQSSTNPAQGSATSQGTTFAGVKESSISGIAEILCTLKLDHYVKVFSENQIDGELLDALSVADLMSELGMKKLEAIRLEMYVKNGHIPK